MSQFEGQFRGALPTPGRGLLIVLIGLLGLWVMFAVAINFGGASEQLFLLFCGNTSLILDGQVWRLFTAPFMHQPSGSIGHILFTLIGLYFLTPSLESQWGSRRMLRFLFLSCVIGYGLQMLVELMLPARLAGRLVGSYWFGAGPAIYAVAVAFALSFRGRTVNLMFVLPVTSRGLLLFVIGVSVLNVVAASANYEGLISPFGGMVAGWALGGSTPSPVRRWYLQLRLRQLDKQAHSESKRRRKASGFKVIEGGASKKDDDGRGPDGKWLN